MARHTAKLAGGGSSGQTKDTGVTITMNRT